MTTPEGKARAKIDQLLIQAGWLIFDYKQADIHASYGVAIREFQLTQGYGIADYLLYLDGKAVGIIEAKKQGISLSGVEHQSKKYSQGLPTSLPAWQRPFLATSFAIFV